MGKRHQASRRRNYNRRQHELHERIERFGHTGRYVAVMDWLDDADLHEPERQWPFEPLPSPALLTHRGVD
jgi:hypothetical protein